MPHRSLAVVLCAFVALTAHVFQGCGLGVKMDDAHMQDLAAIEKVLSQDIAATVSRDTAALTEQPDGSWKCARAMAVMNPSE